MAEKKMTTRAVRELCYIVEEHLHLLEEDDLLGHEAALLDERDRRDQEEADRG